MAKSNNAYIKKLKAEGKRKKRLEKIAKKTARKKESTDGSLENMIAYVDEFGNITSEPPTAVKPPPVRKTDGGTKTDNTNEKTINNKQ